MLGQWFQHRSVFGHAILTEHKKKLGAAPSPLPRSPCLLHCTAHTSACVRSRAPLFPPPDDPPLYPDHPHRLTNLVPSACAGLLSFLFWAEWFTAALLLPWALLAGEVADMWRTPAPLADWAVLWFTAGVGGARIYAQFLFLQETSPTSLAISSIAVNALSSTLGIIFFGTPVTVLLVVGVAETVLATCLYTFLKLNAKKEQQKCDVVENA